MRYATLSIWSDGSYPTHLRLTCLLVMLKAAMNDLEIPRPGHHTAGHDAGVVLGLLAQARQERELSTPEAEPAEERALVTVWGRWPW